MGGRDGPLRLPIMAMLIETAGIAPVRSKASHLNNMMRCGEGRCGAAGWGRS